MGFWSTLGKIGKIAGTVAPFALAPFTGGASLGLGGLTGGLGGAAAAGGLASKIGTIAGLAGIGGDIAGNIAAGKAKNRGEQLAAQQNQQQFDVLRSAEDRATLNNAWKRALNSEFVRNYQGYKPATLHSNVLGTDRTLPSFGIARTTPYDPRLLAEAAGMDKEAGTRLINGSTLPARADMSLTKPSGWETAAGIIGTGLTGASRILPQLKPKQPADYTDQYYG